MAHNSTLAHANVVQELALCIPKVRPFVGREFRDTVKVLANIQNAGGELDSRGCE